MFSISGKDFFQFHLIELKELTYKLLVISDFNLHKGTVSENSSEISMIREHAMSDLQWYP